VIGMMLLIDRNDVISHMQRFQEICDKLFHSNPNVKWFRTMVALERVKATLDVL
jgi:hypothetical protein